MAGFATLHLRRSKQWMSIFRKFRVLLDGECIDRIPRGATRTYEITPGRHELQVTIDWVASPTVEFECETGQHVRYACGHPPPTLTLNAYTLVSMIDLVPDDAPPDN